MKKFSQIIVLALCISGSVHAQIHLSIEGHLKGLDLSGLSAGTNSGPLSFPLKQGNSWEYISYDTCTVDGYIQMLNSTVIKEAAGDTTLPNGFRYAKIIKRFPANSISHAPVYEYLRIDSIGNIHCCQDGKDYLLFDFTKQIGEIYAGDTSNSYWKITDTGRIATASDSRRFVEFASCDSDGLEYAYVKIVDGIGIVSSMGISAPGILPYCLYWGGVLDTKKIGFLLAGDSIDWSEYYPLQTGNFWKYSERVSPIASSWTVKVIGDSTLADNHTYKIIESTDLNSKTKGYHLERLTEKGEVYSKYAYDSIPHVLYRFSPCLGDTFYCGKNSYMFYRINDKTYSLRMRQYPDFVNVQIDFYAGIGLGGTTGEMVGTGLDGAIINGKVYGNPYLAVEKTQAPVSDYSLSACYPNPFNPSTTIEFSLPRTEQVKIVLYNTLGKEVMCLLDDVREKGKYKMQVNLNEFPSGVYYYTMQTNSFRATKKMMLVK